MSYQVLARKYRPQRFDEVMGQEHITRTLKNAIEASRLHHAYLFTGVRGVGKTTVARILAKALNCTKVRGAEPCNECVNCKSITQGTNLDVQEIDGASNTGVDDVREIREKIKFLPSQSRYKIYVIDEVHMLSTSAFNALLKTLEEPPPHVIFIFATTEPTKIPATILSRCQRYDFKRITIPTLTESINRIAKEEGVVIEPDAALAIAFESEGSMRDAQSLFDQAVAFAGANIRYDDLKKMFGFMDRDELKGMLTAVIERDAARALSIVDNIFNMGASLVRLAEEMLFWINRALVYNTTSNPGFLKGIPSEDQEFIKDLAGKADKTVWEQMFRICYRQLEEMGRTRYPKMLAEMLVIELSGVRPVLPVDALVERIDAALASPVFKWDEQPIATAPVKRSAAPATRTAAGTIAKDASDMRTTKTIGPETWKKFMLWLKGEKPQLYSIVEHGVCDGFGAGNSITIQFMKGSIYADMLLENERKANLEEMVGKYFGGKYHIRCSFIDAHDCQKSREEKKREEKDSVRRLKEEALAHEMVKGAAVILEADVREIKVKGER